MNFAMINSSLEGKRHTYVVGTKTQVTIHNVTYFVSTLAIYNKERALKMEVCVI